jgi:hypothetical protein
MTFDDLLAQVQALLQREQRLSYRAPAARFALEEPTSRPSRTNSSTPNAWQG